MVRLMAIFSFASMCMGCIVRFMSKKQSNRRRNISWADEVDKLATELVFDRRISGGVSELLARLVRAEAKRKRGIAHLHPKTAEVSR